MDLIRFLSNLTSRIEVTVGHAFAVTRGNSCIANYPLINNDELSISNSFLYLSIEDRLYL